MAVVSLVAVTGFLAVLGRTAAPVATSALAPAQPLAPLVNEESQRLSRSAIAVHRQTPRPRS